MLLCDAVLSDRNLPCLVGSFYQTLRYHKPDDGDTHNHCWKNLKCRTACVYRGSSGISVHISANITSIFLHCLLGCDAVIYRRNCVHLKKLPRFSNRLGVNLLSQLSLNSTQFKNSKYSFIHLISAVSQKKWHCLNFHSFFRLSHLSLLFLSAFLCFQRFSKLNMPLKPFWLMTDLFLSHINPAYNYFM